jgi:hypothetical protein
VAASAVAASAMAASAVPASAVAATLAVGAIFDAEAHGGVFSIACITVIILRFFGSTAFFSVEGLSFFCKSFVSCGPEDLAAW